MQKEVPFRSQNEDHFGLLEDGTEVYMGELPVASHIFLRNPSTAQWELNPESSFTEKLLKGNNNPLFAGAIHVQLNRLQGIERLSGERFTRRTGIPNVLESEGLYFIREEYQRGLIDFAAALRTVNTLIPDLEMYPNLQHIEKGSGLVAESAFALAIQVLDIPIKISGAEDDHSQGDFYTEINGRRTYWDLTATPNETVIKDKKVKQAKCTPLFFPLKTGNYMRRLPLYASELNMILNTIRMDYEGITQDMLMKGDTTLAAQAMSRKDAGAVIKIVLQYSREILYSLYVSEEITDDQSLKFMAHFNLIYQMLEEKGVDTRE